MVSICSVTLVDGPGMNSAVVSAASSAVCPISGLIAMVTIRSTRWPATRVPATARSSGTLTLTARRWGPFGSYSCPGSRMEKACPEAFEASMVRVTICPVEIGTPLSRPSTSSMRVKAASLVGSAGTLRIATSPSSIGLRGGISRTATTTCRISAGPWGARLPKRSKAKTSPPTISATTRPTATYSFDRLVLLSLYSSSTTSGLLWSVPGEEPCPLGAAQGLVVGVGIHAAHRATRDCVGVETGHLEYREADDVDVRAAAGRGGHGEGDRLQVGHRLAISVCAGAADVEAVAAGSQPDGADGQRGERS